MIQGATLSRWSFPTVSKNEAKTQQEKSLFTLFWHSLHQ
jgi:hypothetical protein